VTCGCQQPRRRGQRSEPLVHAGHVFFATVGESDTVGQGVDEGGGQVEEHHERHADRDSQYHSEPADEELLYHDSRSFPVRTTEDRRIQCLDLGCHGQGCRDCRASGKLHFANRTCGGRRDGYNLESM
jgi:hypothetical protein